MIIIQQRNFTAKFSIDFGLIGYLGQASITLMPDGWKYYFNTVFTVDNSRASDDSIPDYEG